MNRSRLVFVAGSLLATSALLAQGENTSRPSNTQPSGAQQTQSTSATATQQTDTAGRASTAGASGQTAGATASKEAMQSQSSNSDEQRKRTAAAEQGKSMQKSGSSPVVMLFVPVAMEKQGDTTLANGCWAKLYGDNNFGGDSLTLVGPVDMHDMTGPFGVEWGEKVSSIQAGPRATVTIYDNEEFKDRAATIKPKERIAEISKRMGTFEEVKSVRVNCATQSG